MIAINDNYYLSEPVESDCDGLVRWMNDEEIYKNTLRVPKPYTMADAGLFIKNNAEKSEKFGRTMGLRIRLNQSGEAIGGISLHGMYGPASHRDEIGYLLFAPWRGKGIMTAALQVFCKWTFENHPLTRLEATIFDYNIASARMVEKVGFTLEGNMKNYYLKDGKYINGMMYALLK